MQPVLLAALLALSPMRQETLRFLPEDAAALREVHRVSGIGSPTTTRFLTAPVIELLTVGSSTPLVATVLPSDYERMGLAASEMPNSTACEVEKILARRIDVETPPPADPVRRYLTQLRDAAEGVCRPRAPRDPQPRAGAGAPGSLVTPEARPQAQPESTPPDARAFLESQVDKPVTLEPGFPPPKYPDALRGSRPGEVLVSFVVGIDGRADLSTFKVVRSNHELFGAAVRDVLPKMTFTPAELGGRKVRQLVQMPFVFARPSARRRPAGSR